MNGPIYSSRSGESRVWGGEESSHWPSELLSGSGFMWLFRFALQVAGTTNLAHLQWLALKSENSCLWVAQWRKISIFVLTDRHCVSHQEHWQTTHSAKVTTDSIDYICLALPHWNSYKTMNIACLKLYFFLLRKEKTTTQTKPTHHFLLLCRKEKETWLQEFWGFNFPIDEAYIWHCRQI